MRRKFIAVDENNTLWRARIENHHTAFQCRNPLIFVENNSNNSDVIEKHGKSARRSFAPLSAAAAHISPQARVAVSPGDQVQFALTVKKASTTAIWTAGMIAYSH